MIWGACELNSLEIRSGTLDQKASRSSIIVLAIHGFKLFSIKSPVALLGICGLAKVRVGVIWALGVDICKKNVIQYPRFIKLIIADLMEKYPSIPQRIDEYCNSIKDDTPLVSVYSIGNVLFRGIRISDAFINAEIHATNDNKEYDTVFVRVDIPKS
nr:hypothetical protein [Tanacetum cinerariifolium]